MSLGGRTILDFALAHPDRVAAMVLVNPGGIRLHVHRLDKRGGWVRVELTMSAESVDLREPR